MLNNTPKHIVALCDPAIARKVELSVVVPVYNSHGTIETLHRRLCAVLDRQPKSYQIIFVDDASTDGSWARLERIARRDRSTVAVRLDRNMGQGNATILGLRVASGDLVLNLDDDLQHAPEEIPRLLAVLDERPDVDVVFAIPLARRHSWWRRLLSWSANLVASAVLLKSPQLRFSAFRVMRRPVADWLARQRFPRAIVASLLLQHTRRIAYVRVEHGEGAVGRSRYTIGQLVWVPVGYFQGLRPAQLEAFSICSALACGLFAWQLWSALTAAEGATALLVAAGWSLGLALALLLATGSALVQWQARLARREPPLESAIREVAGLDQGPRRSIPDRVGQGLDDVLDVATL